MWGVGGERGGVVRVLTGDTRSRAIVAGLESLGWGRMVIGTRIEPYGGEPWGLDNGAFVCWRRGSPWCADTWLRMLEWAQSQPVRPYLAVLPDRVACPQGLPQLQAWLRMDAQELEKAVREVEAELHTADRRRECSP